MTDENVPLAPSLPIELKKQHQQDENAQSLRNLAIRSCSEDLDSIDQYRLYIGSLEAAANSENLKKLNITHILTVEDHPLDDECHKDFNYKFIRLFDYPSSNILDLFEECFEFIESGIETGVLVHCLVGMSRSASIVIAYLMQKNKMSVAKTLELVKQFRAVRPNNGFYKQLQIFETMNFTVNKESLVYRSFKLDNLAHQIKRGARFDEIFEDEGSLKENQDNVSCYKCKKCRFKLFNVSSLIQHVKSFSSESDVNWSTKLAYFSSLKENENTDANLCKDQLFIEPQQWFADKLSDVNGKLNCPKCSSKLGSFDWVGSRCDCSHWVVPAFHIHSSKVDFCPR